MGYRSSKRNENTSDAKTGVTTSHVTNRTTADSTSATGGWSRQATLAETEAHFGMEVPDKDTVFRLQRLEAMNTTERVRGWVDEGMTVEDMGNPLTMEAFRERQADRPPEVPTNIERQNSRSVQRSEKAASKTGPSGETSVPDPVREVISSTGRSLDASIQRAMEDRMGDSFGDVQVHTGPTAASACESINARAFTVGNHVAFNSGEYDPTSAEGQHVIAHELAHVRQQTGGAVSMLPQQDVELEIDPDPQLEREAEETAQQVMQGGELGIQRLADTEVHIQRKEGLGSHVQQNTETTYPPTNGQPKAQQGGFDEALSLLTNGGVDLDEESVQEVLADLDYTSIMKKMGLAFVKENAAVKSLLAGVDEAHGQLSGRDPTPEETLQNRLGQVDFPEHWMSDLEAMGPPDGWMKELKKHTESVVQSEIGSAESTGDAKSRRK